MKKLLIVLFLFLINTSLVFADKKISSSGEIVKTKVNLTCITDDQSLTQSVSITEIKLKSGKKIYLGFVNGFSGEANITEAFYTISYTMAEDSIKITHSIDRTRATKIETWVLPDGKMEIFRGSCKIVKPKI